MAFKPDIELQGVLCGVYGKANYFEADYWQAPEYLPRGHSTFTPDPLAEDPRRGTMRIAGWLAAKNGWDEYGES